MKFAITKSPTPLLSTENFLKVFTHPLPLDSQGLLKAIETIAFEGTPLFLLERKSTWIYQVEMQGYPQIPLFADSRFLRISDFPIKTQGKKLPSPEDIVEKLKSFIGTLYIWGGNWHLGIPELLNFYPPEYSLDEVSQKKWTLEGVDCSGLLYQVTEGFTPRNTGQLVHFGYPVPIENLSPEEIIEHLKPLDLIVWLGHIVIVLDQQTTIESACSKGGVVTADLRERLAEILQEKIPSNHCTAAETFVIRRWI